MRYSNVQEVISNGSEILFIRMNRETVVNGKNVKGKIRSMKEYGVTSPLLLLPAKFAYDEKLELLDEKLSPVTDEERIKKAHIIMDGNNRYKAYLTIKNEKAKADANGKEYEVGKGLDAIPCLIADEAPEKGVLDTLIEMNTTSVSWNDKDYIRTAALKFPKDELLRYVDELAKKKMSASSISLYVSFGNSLKRAAIANAIKTGKALEGDYNVERAQRIITALKEAGFEQKAINKRYLIQFIISNADRFDKVLEAIGGLTEGEVTYISDNMGKDTNCFNAIKEKM